MDCLLCRALAVGGPTSVYVWRTPTTGPPSLGTMWAVAVLTYRTARMDGCAKYARTSGGRARFCDSCAARLPAEEDMPRLRRRPPPPPARRPEQHAEAENRPGEAPVLGAVQTERHGRSAY
jgi:hypothetical protein